MSTLPSPLLAQTLCLSEDEVLAFQQGETTERERLRINGHIDTCEACRKLLLATASLEEDAGGLGMEFDSTARLAAALGSGLRRTSFSDGKRLAHRFEVTRFIDRGGMGEVYEAFDAIVGARVALKALLSTAREEEDASVSRLGEEVKLARRIAHPNVCRIYDLHEHRESNRQPLRFLAMEFVDGVTLKERLLAAQLPIAEACEIARQLLLGLGAIHGAGVLHLDFKSQNVMLRNGVTPAQAVVMDFSLSRAFEQELRLRTSERHAAGSIGYMSPEQLECQSTIGPAADVYAFGVVLYEMLTGQMPFRGDSPAAIMLKQLKSRPAPPSRLRPEVPAALDELVLTCLSRHARSRFQSAASALEALDRCLRRSSPREPERGPRLGMLVVAVFAAVIAGTLVHLAWRVAAVEASIPPPAASSAEASVAATLPPPPPPAAAPPGREEQTLALQPQAAPPVTPLGASQVEAAGKAAAPAPAARPGPAAAPRSLDTAVKRKLRPPPPAVPAPASPSSGTTPPDRNAGAEERSAQPWVPKRAPDFLL